MLQLPASISGFDGHIVKMYSERCQSGKILREGWSEQLEIEFEELTIHSSL